ncbi:MAG TPA: ribosome biogenesis GTPase Der [Candidatus Polarisedimenticolaceae bacterium]|nr:ribosome biogenesis GTPase Der [Candidatus Polarisedimenticolaceae bacterium]
MEPLIAIVGAPNVGKSTLFNRLVGGRRAIVTGEPGSTRDRQYGRVRNHRPALRVVDTGGLVGSGAAPLAREVERQADAALREAQAAVLVVDARVGPTGLDEELVSWLRDRGLPVLLVANKVDSEREEALAWELHRLGLGTPIPVSALHDRGIDELLAAVDEVIERGEESVEPEEEPRALAVAIVGRPNVGKSSLLNRLVGEERAVVSEVAGTTRDAVDTLLERGGQRYRLIDTAGLRRPGRVQQAVERFSLVRARASLQRCDVAVLVLDAVAGLVAQDLHIAGEILEARKPFVVAVNKWDAVPERESAAQEWAENVRQRLRFAKEVPLLLVSARSGQRVAQLLEHAERVHACGGIRVPTPALNRFLRELTQGEEAGHLGGGLRLFYATQTGVHPPRFVIFCNEARRVHFSVRRRLENGLRERFGFGAAPVLLEFRSRRA